MFTLNNFTLRLANQSDIQEITLYFIRNREFHKEWSPAFTDEYYTEEFQTTAFTTYQQRHTEGTAYKFLLIHYTSVIGIVNLTNIERGIFRNGRLGYAIDEQFKNQGLTTWSILSIKTFAKDILDLHRLEANIIPRNEASRRVVSKCGFIRVGLSPEYLYINNKWEDHEHWAAIL